MRKIFALIFLMTSLHAGDLPNVELTANGDTYLKSGSANKNFGDEDMMRLKSSGKNKALLKFDQSAIESALQNNVLESATLVLSIEDNGNNWGSGRDITFHRLTTAWSELGATWNSPNDSNTSNSQVDGVAWEFGGNDLSLWPIIATPFATKLITSGLSGELSIDVTSEIAAIVAGGDHHGFLIKKLEEGQSGRIQFHTKDSSFAPKLILAMNSNNAPPLAMGSVTPATGIVPLDVAVDASASSDSDGTITNFEFSFSDGVVVSGTSATTNHLFSTANENHYVDIKVTDNDGSSNTKRIVIPVTQGENPAEGTKTGLWITPDTDNILYKNAGESTTLSGSICKVKQSASKVIPDCQSFSDNSLEITAFFPDLTSEVALTITKQNNRRFYSYTTPNLVADGVNTFSVVIGHLTEETKKLMRIQSKLDRRIQRVSARVAHHEGAGTAQDKIDALQALLDDLSATSTSIGVLLSQRPEIISEYRIPLQVDNLLAAQRYYAMMMDGFRYEYLANNGSPIEGEAVDMQVRVTNLRGYPYGLPLDSDLVEFSELSESQLIEDDGREYTADVIYNGNVVHTFAQAPLLRGQSMSFTHPVGAVDPNVFNSYQLEMRRFALNGNTSSRFGRMELGYGSNGDSYIPTVAIDGGLSGAISAAPMLATTITDLYGKIDPNSIEVFANTENVSSAVSVTIQNDGALISLAGDLSFLADGEYTVRVEASDYAGNMISTDVATFTLDQTLPQVAITSPENFLTNSPFYDLEAFVTDNAATTTEVYLNGALVYTTNLAIIDASIGLVEGLNQIDVVATDAAGNISASATISNIELDSVAPAASSISPVDEEEFAELVIPVSGNSNEDLLSATLNGAPLTLSADKRSFTGNFTALVEGDHTLNFSLVDLAGNETTISRDIQIILSILNRDLIAIIPEIDGNLTVQGAEGATRAGAGISVSAGNFNQQTVTADSNGAFSATLLSFSNVTVTATDFGLGRSQSEDFNYNIDTTLSGVVKDTNKVPLAGVTVSILGSTKTAVTNASGIFMISEPPTGDKTIEFDGTTIPVDVSGPNKKFSKVNISVSIGTTQLNVLEDPIYLAPLMFDGTETPVASGSSVIVTSPHAPGVELDIPADTASFPSGVDASINVMEIASDVTSVPVPEYAVPDTVYAFEPSGLTFSEPVKLTLPNVNEFPEGMQVVIMSKNSTKGIWEIDGLARVDVGGATLTTEEDSGITHFSEIFAAPLGPKFKKFADGDRPGTNLFDGAMTTSVTLPSYKSLGNDIAPGLTYNSIQASPTVVISNLFDIPRQEFEFNQSAGGGRSIFGSASGSVEGSAWITPDYLDVQFSSGDINSELMRFTGLPNKSIVSYAMDLSDQPSGSFPYQSRYFLKLKQMVLGTKIFHEKELFKGARTRRESFQETHEIDQVFASEIVGSLNVINQSNSVAGKGWSLSGQTKIYDNGPRVLLHNTNGDQTQFNLDDSIETLIEDEANAIWALDVQWPIIYYTNGAGEVFAYDNTDDSTTSIGTLRGTPDQTRTFIKVDTNTYLYSNNSAMWEMVDGVSEVVEGGPLFSQDMTLYDGNTVLIADGQNSKIMAMNLTTKEFTHFAGNGQSTDHGDGGQAIDAGIYHPSYIFVDSSKNVYVSTERGYIRKIDTNGFISTFAGKTIADGGVFADSAPKEDMNFFGPTGMVVDETNGYLYVSDISHHRIVRINFGTGIAETIAGSGSCDSNNPGDGKAALAASLCFPIDVALDDANNLLIHDLHHQRVRRVNLNSAVGATLTYTSSVAGGPILNKLADGTYKLTYRNGVESEFNEKGLQTLVIDRAGRNSSFEYDLDDRLIKFIDSVGQETIYSYTGDYLSSILDPAGRETFLTYDEDKLVQVDFPDSTSRIFEYDENGLMLAEYNKRGHKTSYVYNEWRRLEKVVRPDLTEIIIQDKGSHTVGNNYTGGASGELSSLENEAVDGIKDARGITTSFSSDENGYVSKITDGNGDVTNIRRDLEGRPVKIIRTDESEVTFVYDETTGDLLQKTDSDTEITITRTYDAYGNLLTQTDPRGNTITNVYDNATGLLTSSTNQLGQVSTQTYYDQGLVKTRTNHLGQTVTFEYDDLGNLSKRIDHEGNVTLYDRDNSGNVTKVTNAETQETVNTYDSFNRILSVTTPKLETTTYEYLVSGELSKIIDPKNNETLFTYNNLGQLIQKVSPLGKVTSLTYDANGNMATEIDPNGNVKTFEYDSLNQLTKKILPDNLYEIAYDVRGNITQIKNDISQIDYTYENSEAGYLVSNVVSDGADLPLVDLSYEYDDSGNRTKMITAAGNFQYAYDSGNRLTAVLNHKGEEFQFDYDDANRLSEISRPGSKSIFTFDQTNFLTSLVHQKLSNSNTINSFAYVKDNIGNRTSMTTVKGVHSYGYDDNNQLTSATHPEASLETFTYDEIGNRKTDQTGSYTYDSNDQRLTEDYNYFYTYDNNGNLTGKVGKSTTEVINFNYSSENQLISIQTFDGTTKIKEVNYAYDAIGRRVEKEVIDLQTPANSYIHRYGYDGNEMLFKYNGSNELLATYTHSTLRTDDILSTDVTADGVTEKVATTAQSYFYIKDGLGSITDIVDSSGNLVQHYVYSSFGKLLKVEDAIGTDITTNPDLSPYFTYTGREYDSESGLYYYRARMYDSSIGRFLTEDPYPGQMRIPKSVNSKYIYGGNNPIFFTDPLGESFFGDVTNWIVDVSADAINITSRALSDITGIDKRYVDGALVVTAAVLLTVYGGPIGTGAAVGLVYGYSGSYDQENPFDESLRWGIVGGMSAAVGGGLGSLASGLGGVAGVIVGGLVGGIGGYYAGGNTAEFLGMNYNEGARFGAIIGVGAGLGAGSGNSPITGKPDKIGGSTSGVKKEVDWNGGRLTPR